MYSQIDSNKRKTWLLMFLSIVVVAVLAYLIDYVYNLGYGLLAVALFFAIISNLVAYFKGDKIALRMNGAKEITSADNPYVYRMVENLAITAGIPTPRVYIIEDPAMNAFATGRKPENSSVAVTRGLIDNLENEELEGVIAHELSHIKNFDVRLMTIVSALVGVILVMVDFAWRLSFSSGSKDSKAGGGVLAIVGLVLIILSPIIGYLIQSAVSRKREFLADASGALLTRYPEGLARALEKISANSQPLKKANHSTAHLFISNPFGRFSAKGMNKFFSTHPPVEARVAELRKIGA